MQDSKTIRRMIWRRVLDDHSLEECVVTATTDGLGIAGHVIAAELSLSPVISFSLGASGLHLHPMIQE